MSNNQSTLDGAAETDMDRCREYVIYQLEERKRAPVGRRQPPPGPAVTIAYETGSGAHEIARRLAPILRAFEPKGSGPWAVFDRQLVGRVLEEHHLPQRLAKFMPEDRRLYFQDVLDELAGLRPPSWVLVPKVIESVLHLANAGHVILVGRGASAITARLSNVFHVRLIASLANRIERVQKLEHLSPAEAATFVASHDRGRGRYVSAYFHTRVDDDLQYHLVVNTDRIPPPEAAKLIADGARRCFQSATGGDSEPPKPAAAEGSKGQTEPSL